MWKPNPLWGKVLSIAVLKAREWGGISVVCWAYGQLKVSVFTAVLGAVVRRSI